MKIAAQGIIFALVSTVVAFAQTPQQVGAWSVYTATGNQSSNQVVLLQTAAQGQYNDAQGNPVQAKLDVICKKGKLWHIAVETELAIERKAESLSAPVPTTRIAFVSEGRTNQSDNWAVLDGGHTVTPYAEVFQGRLTRQWIDRLSGTQKIVVRFEGEAGLLQPTFNTEKLAEALSSVGCSY